MPTTLPHHGLAIRNLPRTIKIPQLPSIAKDLWNHTIQTAQQFEWGACLFADSSGVVADEFVQGYPAENGKPSCVSPCCEPDEEDYEGFAHTHLPDDWSRKPYPGFSPDDYYWTLADGDVLAMVTNGEDIFVLMRIDETRPPGLPSKRNSDRWRERFRQALLSAREDIDKEPRVTRSSALGKQLIQANIEICEEIGFGFYGGPLNGNRAGRLVLILDI